jgi:hypothetical protein
LTRLADWRHSTAQIPVAPQRRSANQPCRSRNLNPGSLFQCRNKRRTHPPGTRPAAPQIQFTRTTQRRPNRGKIRRLVSHARRRPITGSETNPPRLPVRDDINAGNSVLPA